MSHQDTDGLTLSTPHHQDLKRALDWIWGLAQLSTLKFRADCTWTPKAFCFVAMLWAWSDEKTLTDRFFHARKVVVAMLSLLKIPATSYQAFLKMLKTWSLTLSLLLVDALRERMQTDLANRFETHGFLAFGVDGSRLELSRTESNELHFTPQPPPEPLKSKKKPKKKKRPQSRSQAAKAAARAREKKANNPQMWITVMYHIGTGLPWDWRTGPSNSSERNHFQEMIDALPARALVVADAGFVGYETWKKLLESGRHFVIRVGANVRLLRKLSYVEEKGNGLVYLWPDREAKKNHPPLVLRLVVAQGGKHPVYLVTSVLDEEQLSDQQVVEIYALRWGIELFYRHFKQTFERSKLRSHTADHAELEATWSLLGLWAMGLHAQVELASQGVPSRRISVAKFLRAYRRALREYKSHAEPGETLTDLLSKAVIDPYTRARKASRDYPRKKQGHAIGSPEILEATQDQIDRARKIRDQLALGLTA